MNHDGIVPPGPLEILGIDAMEERAYRVLLANRMATAEVVATMLSLSPRKAQQLLNSIESKGLASHSPERPRRYIAAPPELAVEALASQRHADIERARSTIPQLKEHAANSADVHEREQIVEIISNRAALSQILGQLRNAAKSDVVVFQHAPALHITTYPSKISHGLRVRTISDAAYLALPGTLGVVRRDMESGVETRVCPALPIKMLIVDRRVCLVPVNVEDQGGPVLMVRASTLLDSLYVLFELMWAQSTPVMFTKTGNWKAGKADPKLSDAAQQVIPLLAAGLNDKAIASEAGISAATLNRRIAELMKNFGTRTRFQLGWRSAMDVFPERLAASPLNKHPSRSR